MYGTSPEAVDRYIIVAEMFPFYQIYMKVADITELCDEAVR